MFKHARVILCIVFVLAVASAHALASGAWKAASGSLSAGRRWPAMTELHDGRIAVVGSLGSDDGWAALDIYDPAADTWTRGGTMEWGRFDPSLLPLSDGRLFVTGGMSEGGGGLPESELYDPATNAWTRLPATVELGTFGAAAVSLPHDRLLVTGGFYDLTYRGNADSTILDPVGGAGTRVAPMRSRRGYHSLVRLDDTHILAVGGYYDDVMLGATTSTEIYDVTANTWTPAAPTAVGHANAFAARLQDGRVIVAGGNTYRSEAPLTSVEIYDPATNTWTAAPPLGTPRNRVMGGVMFDGRVIVVSGDPVSGGMSAEEWMPGANAWTPIAAPATRAANASAVVFRGGQYILLAGGDSPSGFVTTGEIYKLNHHPVAVATIVTPAAQVLPGNRAAIDVSATGSSDADGDRLTYTWTEGSTVLAQTNDPMARATLGLGIGTHTITLTASDHFNESSSASVTANVDDGTAGNADLVRALQEELRQARQRAAVCELTIGTANTAAELALGLQFGNASFKLPGPTPALKLGAFVVAALTTPSSCQKDMYRTLGGKKQ